MLMYACCSSRCQFGLMEFFFSAIHLWSTFIAKIFDVQQFILRASNVEKTYFVPVCIKVSAFLQHYFYKCIHVQTKCTKNCECSPAGAMCVCLWCFIIHMTRILNGNSFIILWGFLVNWEKGKPSEISRKACHWICHLSHIRVTFADS